MNLKNMKSYQLLENLVFDGSNNIKQTIKNKSLIFKFRDGIKKKLRYLLNDADWKDELKDESVRSETYSMKKEANFQTFFASCMLKAGQNVRKNSFKKLFKKLKNEFWKENQHEKTEKTSTSMYYTKTFYWMMKTLCMKSL